MKIFLTKNLVNVWQSAYLRQTQSPQGLPFPIIILSLKSLLMNLSFNELRRVKHELPAGSISRLAQEFSMSEDQVRNYFGGGHNTPGEVPGYHLESGYGGGVVHLEDTSIFDRALQMIQEAQTQS
jgi:hypothetical protein